MKKTNLDKVLKMLCEARAVCDKSYDEHIEKQISAKTNDQLVWARADKERFNYISECLSEIIYRIEEWQAL